MRPPPVQFVKVGDEHVAYQVVGDGAPPGLALTSWVNAIDGQWEDPEHLRIWRTVLASGGRAIHLDHRGVGSSDSVPLDRIGDLDDWVEDVLAVLDACGVERTSLLAEGEQCEVAVRLAARHPERVDRIVFTAPGQAKWVPGAQDFIAEHWGDGETKRSSGQLQSLDYLARTERLAATRNVATTLVARTAQWDVSADLPNVRAECLVLQFPVPWDAAPFAAALPRAELRTVRPTGNYWGDHTFETILEWVGWKVATGERRLLSLVLTDIVGSTALLAAVGDGDWKRTLDHLDELVQDRAERNGGRVLKHTGDGHLLAFDRPSDAVAAALSLRDAVPQLGLHVRSGVHTGEVEVRDNEEVGGMTVHVAARIGALADSDEVLVSRTVVELAGQSAFSYESRGDHELKGVPGSWAIFAAT